MSNFLLHLNGKELRFNQRNKNLYKELLQLLRSLSENYNRNEKRRN